MILNNLQFGYQVPYLTSDFLEFNLGQAIPLIGANGAGKSTFLKTIAGLIPHSKGEIIIENQSLTKLSLQERSKKIAYVPSTPPLIDQMRVNEYIALGRTPFLGLFGNLQQKDEEIIEQAILKLGLTPYKERFIHELSDGEKQLCTLAKALVQDAPVILLDEPSAFLDYANRNRIVELFKNLAKQENKLFIFSTHDIDLIDREFQEVLYIDVTENKLIKGNISLNKDAILEKAFNRNLGSFH